jgi:1-phosphatidylinositol phosphodiesterase
MGTHSSMGTGTWGDAFQTQGNSLTTQMMMGFRALDIRCRHYNNQFPVHDRLVYLNTNLGAVLATVRSFLLAYPTEAILMHIVQEYTASGNSRTFEQTYVSYRDAYADIIWAPTTQNPLLGEVRGKVVIIQDFTASAIYGLLYTTFRVLPHKVYSTNWDQYDHWLAVKSFLASTNTAGVSRISFWTGNTGSLPYFVASGKSSPGNNDPRLLTGATTILGNVYPDFPRVACLFGLCSIPF